MRLFAQTSKVLYKNLFLMMGYTVFFCYTFWEYRKSFLAMSTYIPNQPAIGFLSVTLSMSLLCTVFFLFFSYVLFAKPQKAGLEECLQATKNGQGKFVGSQFVWIVFLIFVFTVMSFVFNWLYPTTALAGGLYLRHMIGCLFVYMFLVPLTGALLGMAAALSLKPLFAYSIMVLFALFSSPLGGMLAFLVSEATREAVDIFFLFDFFNIFPLDLDWTPLYAFGISLLPYKIAVILFWMLVSLAVVVLKVTKPSQRLLRGVACVCIIACLVNAVVGLWPSSRVDRSYRLDGVLFGDSMFYSSMYTGNNNEEEIPAEFRVTEYVLDVKVKEQLYVTAKIKVDTTNLAIYPFTLYHNYKVQSIRDQNGVALSFRQDIDLVEVYSNGVLSELVFTYSGYNSRFYSNSQGVFLPGYFAYYPIAGQWHIMTSDFQSMATHVLPYETEFFLTVSSPKEIFTNLPSDGDGRFAGKSNGVTMMSGFFESTTVEGVEIIYPTFNTQEFSAENLAQDVQAFLEIEQNVDKILIAPNVNQHSDTIVGFSDYLLTTQLTILPQNYALYTKVLDKKRTLYYYWDMYLNNREALDTYVEKEKGLTKDQRTATLFKKKVEQLEEDVLRKKIEDYLFDGNDTRSFVRFLNEL